MRIIYIRDRFAMAVQILNEMPDAEVHRGDPVGELLRELNAPRERARALNGRAGFIWPSPLACTRWSRSR